MFEHEKICFSLRKSKITTYKKIIINKFELAHGRKRETRSRRKARYKEGEDNANQVN